MNPTVSLAIFTHNDLPMLKATLLHEQRWVDQVCILDMASADGTQEFCEAWLRPGVDVYRRRDTNTCPDLGFSEAKNAVMDMATSDWVLCAGADTIMDWRQAPNIKRVLAEVKADALSINTVSILPFKECQPHQIEEAVARKNFGKDGRHRCFVRRGSGIVFKGYIHEEPFRGEVNVFGEAQLTQLSRFHLHGWGNDNLRSWRYGWMLLRAWQREPALQAYTNEWWYKEYCPQNADLLKRQSEAYEEYRQKTGDR